MFPPLRRMKPTSRVSEFQVVRALITTDKFWLPDFPRFELVGSTLKEYSKLSKFFCAPRKTIQNKTSRPSPPVNLKVFTWKSLDHFLLENNRKIIVMEFDKDRGSQVAKFSTRDIPGDIIFYRISLRAFFYRGGSQGILSRDVINPVHPASYHFLFTRNRDMGVKFFPTRSYPFTKWIQQFIDEATLVHTFRVEIFMRKRDRKLSLPKFVVSCGLY